MFELIVGFWIVAAFAASGAFLCVWPQGRRRRLAQTFAAQRSLVLDDESTALAERILVAGRRGRFVGVTVVLAVAGGGLLLPGELPAGISTVAFVIIPVGANIAGTLTSALAIRRATNPSDDGRRYAHLPTPTLDDLVPPLMRWWSALVLGLATVGVAILLTLGGDADPLGRRGLALAWAISVVAVAATEVTARIVIRTPQPAASPTALALWDEVAAELASVVVAGAIAPILLCVFAASRILPEAGVVTFPAVMLPLLWMEFRRRRWVRDRLWRTAPPPAGVATGAPP
jgi:hypothetical protein